MKMPHTTVISLTVLATWLVNPAHGREAAPSAGSIIARVVARARLVREQNLESRFRSTSYVRIQSLANDGQPKREECRGYENFTLANRPYQRLIAIDGRPLDERELKREAKREREHLEQALDEDDESIVVDEELASKYHYTLVDEKKLAGRLAYVIEFTPRARLETKSRLDRVLNAVSGRLWIDESFYEIARVGFHLDDKINVAWGIGGALWELEGFIERAPVREGTWLPSRFEVVSKGRVLFKRFYSRESGEWSDYEAVDERPRSTAVDRPVP